MKSFILAVVAIAFLIPLTSSAAKKLKLADSVALNAAAPDFRLKDMSGKDVTLSSLKGKVVVLDFWATWCVPCHENFPAVQKVVDHYKNDQNVVFLFIDTREKSADYVQLAKAIWRRTVMIFMCCSMNLGRRESKINTTARWAWPVSRPGLSSMRMASSATNRWVMMTGIRMRKKWQQPLRSLTILRQAQQNSKGNGRHLICYFMSSASLFSSSLPRRFLAMILPFLSSRKLAGIAVTV